MTCPRCKSTKIGVKDSVNNPDTNETYRERKCTDCGKIFHTVEFEAEYNVQFAEDWNKYHRSNKR